MEQITLSNNESDPLVLEDHKAMLSLKRAEYKKIADRYMEAGAQYKAWYYGLAMSGLLLQTICSLLMGSKSINDIKNSFDLSLFIMLVISGVLQSITSFSDLQTKIDNCRDVKLGYLDLVSDLDNFNYNEHTDEERANMFSLVIEKEKMIRANQLQICLCLK